MGQLPRDNNRVPLRWNDGMVAQKSMVFDGGTVNDPGDQSGTGNPASLFTVSGVVAVRLFAVCGVNLAGATATLAVGTADTTAGLIAQTTATEIDAGEIWHDASPDSEVEVITVAAEKIVTDSIVQTVGTADITAGELTYYAIWRPLSEGATLVAA